MYGILLLMSILLYRNYFYATASANTSLKHFTLVVIAAALGYGAAAVVTPLATRRLAKQTWIAILLAAIYAGSDEFHQIFVPSRGPAVADVLLDTAGAIAAQFAVWLILRRENALHSGVESRIS